MANVTLRHLRREFGATVAVDSIDLDVMDGTFTVLLGPSGCGKTTTLNMIAGLEEATSGEIYFDDRPVHHLPPDRRDIAMVFQSYALYPNRTVRDNIAFPLLMRGVKRAKAAGQVEAAAAKLGLLALLDRRPRELSGGQQQRVALARAIVRRPTAFLLDEPLSNLDAMLRNGTRIRLKELQQELGGTFIMVTHDQVEAMSLADVLVVLDQGRIQQMGPPLEVYQRPQNRFVAAFVGVPSMNLVDGVIEDGTFCAPGWGVPLPEGARPGPVVLGLRAEDVLLTPVSGGGNGLVRIVEHLGSDALVVVSMAFGDLIARVPADTKLQSEDRVSVAAGPRLHLFDADEAGRRRDVMQPADAA
jgi:ABC-type sugar transport system ATPase subunit